jgi:hypothetical protein
MKESELAEEIITYLEKKGYTSYKEVSMRGKGGNARSDCYFTKEVNGKTETIAVETKTSMTLKVIEQADRWKSHANQVYVCVPTVTRKGWKGRKFAIKMCKALGIGVFEYGVKGIKESNIGLINEKAKMPPLYEEQKDSVAGNDSGQFFTAFKNTVNELDKFMDDKDEYLLTDLIKEINHHYKSENSAKSSLKKMIERKVIDNYTIEKKSNKIYVVSK